MFVIYGTDAPLYHLPIVTIAMVVVNCIGHWIISTFGVDATPYYLYFGDGFHPLQWLTHNFLHGGPLKGWPHLIFNMIFLWPFGMIVEGKIGWWRMLLLYLGICVCQGFTQQALMLPSDPKNQAADFVKMLNDPENPMTEQEQEDLYEQFREDLLQTGTCSLGSSAVIFGLMAICAIWAPVNEFESYFRWSAVIRASGDGIRDWTVGTVCGMFVAKEFGMFLLQNGAISSAALHLNGFVVGGAIGLAMLYLGFVDCEGFDAISVLTGERFKANRTLKRERKERQAAAAAAEAAKGPPQAVVPQAAHVVARQIRNTQPPMPPPEPAIPVSIAPAPPPPVPLQPVESAAEGLAGDLALPEFDDATAALDPVEASRNKIEAAIAQGKFPWAVKMLATERKQHRDFVLSAISMGKLAEGLIRQEHIKPALTVLSIGSQAYPAYAPQWNIRAASVQLSVNQDPIAAIKLLQQVDKGMLDRKTREQYLKIAKRAKQMASGL